MLELHLVAVVDSEKSPSNPALVITRFPCVLGRGSGCDYHLDNLLVSRRHCAFSVRGGRVWIEDLGSRNGTHLNGDALTEARPLEDGDLLQFASLSFQIRFQQTPPEQGAAAQSLMFASTGRSPSDGCAAL
jgi:pSer/pThr/pTyr-binding forkhead associated (FHA) protein